MKTQTSEVKNFMFFKIPQAFFTNEKYFNMSIQAKILYSIINDRIQLSRKNNLCDEEGSLYTIFPYKEMAKVMGVTERSIANYMSELKKHDLVLVKKQGWDLPSLIFLGLPEEDNDDNEDEKNDNGKKKNNSSCSKKTVASSNINKTYLNKTNNNNNTDTDTKEDTIANGVSNPDDETPKEKDVVINSNPKPKQKRKPKPDSDRYYKQEDVERLFNLAKKVSSAIGIPLLQKLLKRYSYKEIEDKLLYMQKFKQRNTIYNPCGFLVSSLKENYTIIDKAKAILDKANKAIAKSYQELEEYRKIKPASKQVSLSWLKSMKLQLGGSVI